MQLIAFITECAVIVRILDHLSEPRRAPRMAPIRGSPSDGNMTRQEDFWAGRSRQPDPPVVVMPDYENHNHDLVCKPKSYGREPSSKPRQWRRSLAKRPKRRVVTCRMTPRDGEGNAEGRRAPERRGRGQRGMRAGRLIA